MSNKYTQLNIMLLPGVILLLIFSYGPMLGLVMAFQKFHPVKGFLYSPFIGFDNFKYVFAMPGTMDVIWNTVFIAFMKLSLNIIFPVTFALLMNEVNNMKLKKIIQTSIYLPYFLSWVILAGIMKDLLSPSTGIVNAFIQFLGFEPIYFLGKPEIFPSVIIVSHIWKEFGYGTIIYLAALTSIDLSLYEAAIVDGANRWKQTLHVTLPGIAQIVVLMSVLSMGNVLNAGFDQIFNLYSPIVYKTGDVLETLVYRIGLIDSQFSVATAMGFFKSCVSFVFITTSYWIAEKFFSYRVF